MRIRVDLAVVLSLLIVSGCRSVRASAVEQGIRYGEAPAPLSFVSLGDPCFLEDQACWWL